MRKYIVTIRRVTYTDILVEAESMDGALVKVRRRGADLALTDFPQRDTTASRATAIRVRADPTAKRSG